MAASSPGLVSSPKSNSKSSGGARISIGGRYSGVITGGGISWAMGTSYSSELFLGSSKLFSSGGVGPVYSGASSDQ